MRQHVAAARRHVPLSLEPDPLVRDRERRLAAEHLAHDPHARVVRAAARRVVLAERLDRDAEQRPARRPVDAPGQLAAAGHRHRAGRAAGAGVVDRASRRAEKPVTAGLVDAAAGRAAAAGTATSRLDVLAGQLVQDRARCARAPRAPARPRASSVPTCTGASARSTSTSTRSSRQRREERLEEVLGVRRVRAAGARDLGERPADERRVALGIEERVDAPQRIEVVGDEVEARRDAAIGQARGTPRPR